MVVFGKIKEEMVIQGADEVRCDEHNERMYCQVNYGHKTFLNGKISHKQQVPDGTGTAKFECPEGCEVKFHLRWNN